MSKQLSDLPEMDKIDSELKEIDNDVKKAEKKKQELKKARKRLELELNALWDWIMETDDPNITALRQELLAAARLIKEKEEISDEELDDLIADEMTSFDEIFDKINDIKKTEPYQRPWEGRWPDEYNKRAGEWERLIEDQIKKKMDNIDSSRKYYSKL